MKTFSLSLAVLFLSGCASCHQNPPVQAGIPIAGATVSSHSAVASAEATPAVGFGWETVSFSIPKPKLFAVPKPQAGPQVVGIPILAGGPSMTMGAPMAAPMVAAAPQAMMAQQPQYVQTLAAPSAAQQSVPQSNPQPQSAPCESCQPACSEGCASQASVAAECDALIREISSLQEQICVETNKASVLIKK